MYTVYSAVYAFYVTLVGCSCLRSSVPKQMLPLQAPCVRLPVGRAGVVNSLSSQQAGHLGLLTWGLLRDFRKKERGKLEERGKWKTRHARPSCHPKRSYPGFCMCTRSQVCYWLHPVVSCTCVPSNIYLHSTDGAVWCAGAGTWPSPPLCKATQPRYDNVPTAGAHRVTPATSTGLPHIHARPPTQHFLLHT